MIRNYLGFPRGISGMRLAHRSRNQAIRFGTRFLTGWSVDALVPGTDGAPHRLRTEGGDVLSRSVVVATGVAYRRLGVDAAEDLVGRGVHYGAAVSASRAPEVCRDDHGFVLAGRDVPAELWREGRPPAGLETVVPGILVAGHVRAGSMQLVAAAAGEGASVVPLVHARLDAVVTAGHH